MTRNPKADYTQYVHEYTDEKGRTRYAVAAWDDNHAQFICPLDKRTRELTGCYAEFSRTPAGLGGYLTRSKALRRARYLFGNDDEE